MGGHIKLDRKILEWEWYQDINTKVLFIHMLIKANWKDAKFRGEVIERGSFVTSVAHLSEETSLTTKEVRTALSHLEATGEIERKTTNRYTIITIRKYNEYQDCGTVEGQTKGKQGANKGQSNGKLRATIEEEKEVKKKKKIEYPQSFEDFWNCYPRKVEKQSAFRCYKTRLKEYTEDELMTACKAYAKACKNTDPSFIKHASTFLGPDKPFTEYLEQEVEKPKGAIIGIEGWF